MGHPVHGLLSADKASINEILKQFAVSTNEFIKKLSQSTCFKPLYERSNPVAHPVHSLLSADNASTNEILKQFGVSTNEICQEKHLCWRLF